MTFYETLKREETSAGYVIKAVRSAEKLSSLWNYEIRVLKESGCIDAIPCARTTWKKRFPIVKQQYEMW